jgi:hypothetical protein
VPAIDRPVHIYTGFVVHGNLSAKEEFRFSLLKKAAQHIAVKSLNDQYRHMNATPTYCFIYIYTVQSRERSRFATARVQRNTNENMLRTHAHACRTIDDHRAGG